MTDTTNVRPLNIKRGDEITSENAVTKPIAGLLNAYSQMTVEQQARAGTYFLGYVYDADAPWARRVLAAVATGNEGAIRQALPGVESDG